MTGIPTTARARRVTTPVRAAALGTVLAASLLGAACTSDVDGDGVASTAATPAAAGPISGFVAVDDGVVVEYRDWGGEGPPIVLLTGLGNTAAVFDDLAPRLTANHRVVGLTRRGFAPSTITEDGYDVPTRVADDLAALDALGIDRALLVGHSISGDELTGIAAARPGLPAGLVYLDSAVDRSDPSSATFDDCAPLIPSIEDVVDTSDAVVEVDGVPTVKDLPTAARLQGAQIGADYPLAEVRRSVALAPGGTVVGIDPTPALQPLTEGTNAHRPDYAGISVPVTALYGDDADPAVAFPVVAAAPAAEQASLRASLAECASQVAAFKRIAGADRVRAQVPGAVIEIVPGGPHYFFLQQPELVADRILDTARRAGW